MARGRSVLLALVSLLAAPLPALAAEPLGGSVGVRSGCLEARFDLEGARLVALATRVEQSGLPARDLELVRAGEPSPLRVRGVDASFGARFAQLRYTAERREEPRATRLILRAALGEGSDVDVVQTYTFAREACSIELSVALEGPGAQLESARAFAFELAATSALTPRPAAGLGGMSEKLRAIQVDGSEARDLHPAPTALELGPGRWVGLRNRFWTLLVASAQPASADIDARSVRLRPSAPGPLQLRLYVGPVERSALAAVDPGLGSLLFSGRSVPIRALCILLAALLGALVAAVGHAGLAIVLLSPAVKLLLLPLTRIAERWQREVDEARTRLAPGLAEIRARYRGEERSRRALELHGELGVPMLFGLKSLLGVAIQLPVFIAAFHVLDESIALLGAPLLWIEDLSLPDRLATLPLALPFFGDGLHLMPFVMMTVTILSTQLHGGGPLDPELRRKQRRGLHAMAAAFFLLFYTFPAGMVLYWTTNNLSAPLLQALVERTVSALGPEWRAWRG